MGEETDERQPTLSTLSKDVLRAALVDIVSRALLAAVLSVGALVGLLIWQGGSIPAWIAVLIASAAMAVALVSRRRLTTLQARLERRDKRIAELEPLVVRGRRGDTVVGVFNCVASLPNVFGMAERSYVTSLGSVLSVAVNIWLEQQEAAGPGG